MVAGCNIIININIILLSYNIQNVAARDQRPAKRRLAYSRADGGDGRRVGAIYRLPPPLELGYVQ